MIECFIVLPKKIEILNPFKLTYINCTNLFEDLDTAYDYYKQYNGCIIKIKICDSEIINGLFQGISGISGSSFQINCEILEFINIEKV